MEAPVLLQMWQEEQALLGRDMAHLEGEGYNNQPTLAAFPTAHVSWG